MKEEHIAVLSDIHGNSWALREVLADIRERKITKVFNLGDILYGPLDPLGTAEILMQRDLLTVIGNEDRILLEGRDLHPDNPTLDYVLKEIDSDIREWLGSHKSFAVSDDTFFLCHGTPERDDAYLIVNVTAEGAVIKKPADLEQAVQSVKQAIILCGHSHMPRMIRTLSGKWIINPGSVGLQAYTDTQPILHAMENGHPYANYCILILTDRGCWTNQICLPYDWEAAAARAEQNGRPDWAAWLRTGSVEGT
jgi:putative phosphoesterase